MQAAHRAVSFITDVNALQITNVNSSTSSPEIILLHFS